MLICKNDFMIMRKLSVGYWDNEDIFALIAMWTGSWEDLDNVWQVCHDLCPHVCPAQNQFLYWHHNNREVPGACVVRWVSVGEKHLKHLGSSFARVELCDMCFDIGIEVCGPNEALVISGLFYVSDNCYIPYLLSLKSIEWSWRLQCM